MQTLTLSNKQYQLPTLQDSIPQYPTVTINDLPTISSKPTLADSIPNISDQPTFADSIPKLYSKSTTSETTNSPYVDIYNPTQVNSFLDVVSNAFDPVDNGGHIFSFAELWDSTGELLNNWIFNPLKQGNLAALGWNTLMNMGESMDIVYNIIKATMSIENTTAKNYKFKSVGDRIKAATGIGVKGRYNFDWDFDLGSDAADLAVDMIAETFLDPFTYISFGTSAILKGTTKATGAATKTASKFTKKFFTKSLNKTIQKSKKITLTVKDIKNLVNNDKFGKQLIDAYLSKDSKLENSLIHGFFRDIGLTEADLKTKEGRFIYKKFKQAIKDTLITSEETATHKLNKTIINAIHKNKNTTNLLRNYQSADYLKPVKKAAEFKEALEWIDSTYVKFAASFFTPIAYALKYTSKPLFSYVQGAWVNLANKYNSNDPKVTKIFVDKFKNLNNDLHKAGIVGIDENDAEDIANLNVARNLRSLTNTLTIELLKEVKNIKKLTNSNIKKIYDKALSACKKVSSIEIETLDDYINYFDEAIKQLKTSNKAEKYTTLINDSGLNQLRDLLIKINDYYKNIDILLKKNALEELRTSLTKINITYINDFCSNIKINLIGCTSIKDFINKFESYGKAKFVRDLKYNLELFIAVCKNIFTIKELLKEEDLAGFKNLYEILSNDKIIKKINFILDNNSFAKYLEYLNGKSIEDLKITKDQAKAFKAYSGWTFTTGQSVTSLKFKEAFIANYKAAIYDIGKQLLSKEDFEDLVKISGSNIESKLFLLFVNEFSKSLNNLNSFIIKLNDPKNENYIDNVIRTYNNTTSNIQDLSDAHELFKEIRKSGKDSFKARSVLEEILQEESEKLGLNKKFILNYKSNEEAANDVDQIIKDLNDTNLIKLINNASLTKGFKNLLNNLENIKIKLKNSTEVFVSEETIRELIDALVTFRKNLNDFIFENYRKPNSNEDYYINVAGAELNYAVHNAKEFDPTHDYKVTRYATDKSSNVNTRVSKNSDKTLSYFEYNPDTNKYIFHRNTSKKYNVPINYKNFKKSKKSKSGEYFYVENPEVFDTNITKDVAQEYPYFVINNNQENKSRFFRKANKSFIELNDKDIDSILENNIEKDAYNLTSDKITVISHKKEINFVKSPYQKNVYVEDTKGIKTYNHFTEEIDQDSFGKTKLINNSYDINRRHYFRVIGSTTDKSTKIKRIFVEDITDDKTAVDLTEIYNEFDTELQDTINNIDKKLQADNFVLGGDDAIIKMKTNARIETNHILYCQTAEQVIDMVFNNVYTKEFFNPLKLEKDTIYYDIYNYAYKLRFWRTLYDTIENDLFVSTTAKRYILDVFERYADRSASWFSNESNRLSFISQVNALFKMDFDKSISLDTLRNQLTNKSLNNDYINRLLETAKGCFNNTEDYEKFLEYALHGHTAANDAAFTELAIRTYDPTLAVYLDNLSKEKAVILYDTETTGLNTELCSTLSIAAHKWGCLRDGSYVEPLFNKHINCIDNKINQKRYAVDKELLEKFNMTESQYKETYLNATNSNAEYTSENLISDFVDTLNNVKDKTKQDFFVVSYNGSSFDDIFINNQYYNFLNNGNSLDAYNVIFKDLKGSAAGLTITETSAINSYLNSIVVNLKGFDFVKNFSNDEHAILTGLNDLKNSAKGYENHETALTFEALLNSLTSSIKHNKSMDTYYIDILGLPINEFSINDVKTFLSKESPELFEVFDDLSISEKTDIRNIMFLYIHDKGRYYNKNGKNFTNFYNEMMLKLKDPKKIYNYLNINDAKKDVMVKYLLRRNQNNYLKETSIINYKTLETYDYHVDNIHSLINSRIKNVDNLFGKNRLFKDIEELKAKTIDLIEHGTETSDHDMWFSHLDPNKFDTDITWVAVYYEISEDPKMRNVLLNRIIKDDGSETFNNLLKTASPFEKDYNELLDCQDALDCYDKLSVKYHDVADSKSFALNVILQDLFTIQRMFTNSSKELQQKYMDTFFNCYYKAYYNTTLNLLDSFTKSPDNIIKYLLFRNTDIALKKHNFNSPKYNSLVDKLLKNKQILNENNILILEDDDTLFLMLDGDKFGGYDNFSTKAKYNNKEYIDDIEETIYTVNRAHSLDKNEKRIIRILNDYLIKQYQYTGQHHCYYGHAFTEIGFEQRLKSLETRFNTKIKTIDYVDQKFFNTPRFREDFLFNSSDSLFVDYTNSYTSTYTPLGFMSNQLKYIINSNKCMSVYADLINNKEYCLGIADAFGIKEITDASIDELYNVLKYNDNDFVAIVFVKDSKNFQGFRAEAIDISNKVGIRKALEMNAAYVPYSVYSNIFEAVNNNPKAYGSAVGKIVNKVMYLFKLGYLTGVGPIIRNMFDAYLKNIIETNDLKSTSINTVKAIKIIQDYNDIINKYFIYTTKGRTDYSNATITPKALSDFYDKFNEVYNFKLSKEEFQFAHEFLYLGSSVGEVGALSKFTKSKIIKGNSFLSKLGDTLLKPNAYIEKINRFAEYLTLIEKGYSKSTVFSKIAHSQFDYANKSLMTKRLEYIIPFFNFTKNNLEFWMDVLLENPRVIAILDDMFGVTLNSFDFDMDEYENNRSLQYHIMNGSIPLTDDNLVLKLNPSYLDALNLIMDPENSLINKIFAPIGYLSFAEGSLWSQIDNESAEPWEDIIKPFISSTVPFFGPLFNKIDTAKNTLSKNTGGEAQKIIGHAIPSLFSNVTRWSNYKYDNKYLSNIPTTSLRTREYLDYSATRSYNYYNKYSYVSNRLNYSYKDIYKNYKKLKYLRYKVSGVWEP